MSFARQLREQFTTTDKPSAEGNTNATPPPTPQQGRASVAIALGINSIGMVDAISSDILDMLKKNQRYSLDGYVYCLSRIISHATAWECIIQSYKTAGEAVPKKYQQLFDKEIADTSPRKTMSVE